ncbi:SAM-dependent methyltransferase [Wenjunlia tyrosinilytica]|jgi:hypothetical protein|uniref:S-adenosyl methyltransferase n=1 Tax=Wenjunlia tyrosinilytica TaxID=1544741 RepID=A0A917ZUP9_9ACTN|nr:SAM-dependent methyltransferase [Wenjunlia tyrosinilytica]GGO94002.1 hypothetical protein GCM10012280_47800 [Wenjunlia tyrosinilytica]
MANTGEDKWTVTEDAYHPPTELHTDRPHAARMYDYLLGGKDNYAADREAAEKAVASFPTLRTAARENRNFLGRVVRHLVRETPIRQFLDIGSGLPTAENVHQVAQRDDPDARVVYVDNDPIVLAHGRALLAENDRTTVIQADARTPDRIIEHCRANELIDFTRPVAVLAVALLHFVPDAENPSGIIDTLRESVPPDSHIVLSHATADISPETALGVQATYQAQGVPLTLRSRSEFEKFFAGLEIVDPGIQVITDWRSDVPPHARPPHADVSWYGGLGRLTG